MLSSFILILSSMLDDLNVFLGFSLLGATGISLAALKFTKLIISDQGIIRAVSKNSKGAVTRTRLTNYMFQNRKY